ncbi:peptide-N(4)-(N-acetyl-beta-glucosaminyl)asparagine amidase [Octopus sinensis]|uniref:Peptide-N(4)-(N-acetyl-beta-glucosaminyl)asparagine amidase n=1 Tax=Octopus sinensis TaxID=2607531 RepID=A0A6P7SYD4_9MOLL|nr:peptide-N(4)-(N-acetyl-beta-glucosaminyl)asparagine amidase [Octopus sinensis]
MAHGYDYDFLNDICDNPQSVVDDTLRVILRICKNITDNPGEQKYRRLRIGNKIVQEKILPVDGAFNCLLAIGFQEDDEFLTLPESDMLFDLIRIQKYIENILNMKSEEKSVLAENEPKQVTSSFQNPSEPRHSITSTAQQKNEEIFYSTLLMYVKRVQQYEKFSLLKKARQIIPIAELKEEAKIKLESICDAESSYAVSLEDCLLIVLLNWFKNKFFKWFDKPLCTFCSCKNVIAVGSDHPNDEESYWKAGNVELYSCPLCNVIIRFPRYNSPEKLLETRQGRCGEWANCFTLCCRAMGFEARLVVSWKDHVWTEVFSECQDRWLHCDPCENVCDKPLLYEAGWKVEISYIIGFSRDDTQDVTWRYSAQHEKVKQKRTKVSEKWLQQTLAKIRTEQSLHLSQERKKLITFRSTKELTEFSSHRTPKSDELQGRTTGSLAWRLQRGETKKHTPYTFKPDIAEQQSKCLYVKYSCAKDIYYRPYSSKSEIHCWQSLLFSYKDIFRKEEHDWKKVYLSRTEGCEFGEVSWKFDVSECGLTIAKLEVWVSSETFENGEVLWQLKNDKNKIWTIEGGSLHVISDIKGSRTVCLSAQLHGGQGDNAWQHAQLFRQGNTSREYPLQLTLHLQ